MQNAIIVHGMPDKEEYYNRIVPSMSNNHWLPWLQKQLLTYNIEAHTPEIPNAFKPHYPTWVREFERFDVNAKTILIGHSCGGGFLLRWLSGHKDRVVDKVILVAPWIDPDREETTNFFDFTIDVKLAERITSLAIFYSLDDYKSVVKTVEIIKKILPQTKIFEYKNKGHFTYSDMKSNKFPELLDAILSV